MVVCRQWRRCELDGERVRVAAPGKYCSIVGGIKGLSRFLVMNLERLVNMVFFLQRLSPAALYIWGGFN